MVPPARAIITLDALGRSSSSSRRTAACGAAARAGVALSEQQALDAITAEIAYYRAHLASGSDEAGWSACATRCAVLGERSNSFGVRVSTIGPGRSARGALRGAALRPYCDVPSALRTLRAAGHRPRRRLQLGLSLHECCATQASTRSCTVAITQRSGCRQARSWRSSGARWSLRRAARRTRCTPRLARERHLRRGSPRDCVRARRARGTAPGARRRASSGRWQSSPRSPRNLPATVSSSSLSLPAVHRSRGTGSGNAPRHRHRRRHRRFSPAFERGAANWRPWRLGRVGHASARPRRRRVRRDHRRVDVGAAKRGLLPGRERRDDVVSERRAPRRAFLFARISGGRPTADLGSSNPGRSRRSRSRRRLALLYVISGIWRSLYARQKAELPESLGAGGLRWRHAARRLPQSRSWLRWARSCSSAATSSVR